MNTRVVSVSTVERREVPALKHKLESPSLYPSGMTTRPNPAWAFPSGELQLVGREQTFLCVLPHLSSSPVSRDSHPAKHPKIQRGLSTSSKWHPSALANLVLSFPTPLPNEEKCLESSGLFVSCKFSNRTTLRLF